MNSNNKQPSGVVDERAAFDMDAMHQAAFEMGGNENGSYTLESDELELLINQALAAQPDHSAQSLNMVPDAVVSVGFDVVDRQHIPTINVSLPACAVDDQAAWNRRDAVAASIRSMLALLAQLEEVKP